MQQSLQGAGLKKGCAEGIHETPYAQQVDWQLKVGLHPVQSYNPTLLGAGPPTI